MTSGGRKGGRRGGGGGGGGGGVVFSVGPEGCSSSSRLERSATSRDSQTIYATYWALFKLICGWAKPQIRTGKNGVGLGTRLHPTGLHFQMCIGTEYSDTS